MIALTDDELARARRAAVDVPFEVLSGQRLPGGRINDTFLLATTRGDAVLRAYPRTRRVPQIEFELSVLTHLIAHGCAVCSPLALSEASLVHFVDEQPHVWLHYLEGSALNEQDVPTARELRSLLLPIFEALGHFTPPYRPTPETHVFRQAMTHLEHQLEIAGEVNTAARLRAQFEALASWERAARLPTAVIHADIHPGNLLRSADGRLWLLDFDDAHVGTRSLDWTLAALEFSFDGNVFSEARFHELMAELTPEQATAEERAQAPQLRELLLLKFAAVESALGTQLRDNRYLKLLLKSAAPESSP